MKKTLALALTAGLVLSLAAAPTAFAAEDADETTAITNTATADEAVAIEGNEHTFNIAEATMVQKQIAHIVTLSDADKLFYDVNNDGKLNISDVTLIQQFVACVKGTPKYYTSAGYATIEHEAEYETIEHEAEYETVEHPAEYETVTVVDQEETTKSVPTYVYDERYICTDCGKDITDIKKRMDIAVNTGEIVPGDGNYEKLTVIDGHYYNFTDSGLTDEDDCLITNDFSYHYSEDKEKFSDADGGWTAVSYWLYYGTSTYVSGEDYKNDIEGYSTNGEYENERGDLQLVYEDYKAPTKKGTYSRRVIYKTVTVPAQTHTEQKLVKEAYTEQVLVKEAYTEQVLVKEAYTEQIYVEAGWH